jgi:hypothetical protein
LNFILQKTKQLKNSRQKKKYDREQVKKSQTTITPYGASPQKRSGKKRTLTKDDRIRMILTGGKDSTVGKSRSNKKKMYQDIYGQ